MRIFGSEIALPVAFHPGGIALPKEQPLATVTPIIWGVVALRVCFGPVAPQTMELHNELSM